MILFCPAQTKLSKFRKGCLSMGGGSWSCEWLGTEILWRRVCRSLEWIKSMAHFLPPLGFSHSEPIFHSHQASWPLSSLFCGWLGFFPWRPALTLVFHLWNHCLIVSFLHRFPIPRTLESLIQNLLALYLSILNPFQSSCVETMLGVAPSFGISPCYSSNSLLLPLLLFRWLQGFEI